MTPASAVALAAAIVLLGARQAEGSQPVEGQPKPVYAVTVADATSAGSTPPANPLGGAIPVDSYTADVYERPFRSGPGGLAAAPAIDIVSTRAGAGAAHLYYRMDLAASDPGSGSLAYSYAFEIDYDDDSAADLLVRVDQTDGGRGKGFGTGSITAFWNENSNVTGPNPGVPDGPDATPDGYEVVVFENGSSRRPGAPGGATPIVARIAPDRAASVELAVDAAFLQHLNGEVPVSKVAFRAGAAEVPLDPRNYYLHDKLGRAGAGSPYPFLQLPGAPASCPAADSAITVEERLALDSGTGQPTGIVNPCHPTSALLSAYDNTAFTVTNPLAPGSTRATAADDPDVSPSGRTRGAPAVVLIGLALVFVGSVAFLRRLGTEHRRPPPDDTGP